MALPINFASIDIFLLSPFRACCFYTFYFYYSSTNRKRNGLTNEVNKKQQQTSTEDEKECKKRNEWVRYASTEKELQANNDLPLKVKYKGSYGKMRTLMLQEKKKNEIYQQLQHTQ